MAALTAASMLSGSTRLRSWLRGACRRLRRQIAVPAIVTAESFARVQQRLEGNKRFAARNTKVPSLLQGLAACSACGYGYYRTSAAVLLLDEVAGCGQVGDDAVGAALGDAQAGGDVAQARARVVCDAHQHPGVASQETPAGCFRIANRRILSTGCWCTPQHLAHM